MADEMSFEPHCSACYNFLRGNKEERKTVWLVPHFIKRYPDGNIKIIWACNYGHVCEASCIYARAEREVIAEVENGA